MGKNILQQKWTHVSQVLKYKKAAQSMKNVKSSGVDNLNAEYKHIKDANYIYGQRSLNFS